MSLTIYLRSYDRYVDILRYTLPEGDFTIVSRDQLTPAMALTFGTFTREGEHVAGVFASPDGPIFFLDSQPVICRFGQTSATAVDGHFTFQHGDQQFSLRYRPREGIGTNPYDNEPEDVDLFAMLSAGFRNPQFFKNYQRPHV